MAGSVLRGLIWPSASHNGDSHLADELTAKGIDDGCDGGGRTLAYEVEIEHALDGAGLHTAMDESAGVILARWRAHGERELSGTELDEGTRWTEEDTGWMKTGERLTRRSIVSWCERGCERAG